MQTRSLRRLTGFDLKLIALVLMVLDHIHYFFGFTGWIPEWFSMLGRLSAPLFLFCVVEGFTHTHDRRAYFLRIYAISIAMGLVELAFHLVPALKRGDGFIPMNAAFQNFVVLIVIMQGFEWCRQRRFARGLAAILLPLVVLPLGATWLLNGSPEAAKRCGLLVNVLHFSILPLHTFNTDGSTTQILLGLTLYLLRDHRRAQAAAFFAVDILLNAVMVLLVVPDATLRFMLTEAYEWMSAFAAVPMLMYNGKRGRGMKGLFYTFYPAHVYGFYALSCLLYGALKG